MSREKRCIEALREKCDALQADLDTANQVINTMCAEKTTADKRIAALTAERDALQRFKDFVHCTLDGFPVPTHPDGPHSKEGCRIGDRLEWIRVRLHPSPEVVARVDAAVREALRDPWGSPVADDIPPIVVRAAIDALGLRP